MLIIIISTWLTRKKSNHENNEMKDYFYTATITRIVVSLTSMDMQNQFPYQNQNK